MFYYLVFPLLFILGPQPLIAGDVVLPPVVDYNIQAVLDVDAKTVTGEEVLRYTNHAPDIITELRFHMYLNAFKNNDSTYMREVGGRRYRDEERWGYIHPTLIEVTHHQQTKRVEPTYVAAEDSAPGDQTVLAIPLDAPLMPGESLSVRFEFVSKIPKNQDRVGYAGNYFNITQWFPKIGVWETAGQRGRKTSGWNCHSFHANTEFYADFGRYRVGIEVPEAFQVAAVGVRDETAEERHRQTWSQEKRKERNYFVFSQDRIHDFAFVASSDVVFEERLFRAVDHLTESEIRQQAERLGVVPEVIKQRDVRVLLYIQPEYSGQIERHFDVMMKAIKYHALWFGEYPYPVITMVVPPVAAIRTSGMEYPTLVILRSHLTTPVDDMNIEDIIIHEFGHQYWYGLVASNEFEEAWLDEGVTTFTTNKMIDMLHPNAPVYTDVKEWRYPVPTFLGNGTGGAAEAYLSFGIKQSSLDAVVKPAWTYFHNDYDLNAYVKPGNFLVQLERELGEDVMARVLYQWAMDKRFKHPDTRDFMDTVNRASGRHMDWFFEALFFKPVSLDYSVDRVRNYPIKTKGYQDTETGPQRFAESKTTEVQAQVWLRNHGTTAYPVAIEVTFDDGDVARETWDGGSPWTQLVYEGRGNVVKVVIDPDNRLVLDPTPLNNSWRETADSSTAARLSGQFMVKVQHLLQFALGVL